MTCSVCAVEVDEAVAARLFSWTFCPDHAALAVAAGGQVNRLFSDMGIDADKQAKIVAAGQGVWQAYRALDGMRERKEEAP